MIQLQVVLKSSSVINPSVTNYNFESVEQGLIFAENCAVKDSVSVELNSLDEAGQVVERIYFFDAHAVEEVLEPVVEEVAEVVAASQEEELKALAELSAEEILESSAAVEVLPESIAEEAKEEVLEEPAV